MKRCPDCNTPNSDDSTHCSECGADLTCSATPQTDAFVGRLQTEVGLWQAERLVDEHQANVLLARYGLIPNETAATVKHSRIASIIAVLGVILVGIGAILMMGANWQEMPEWLRFAVLAGSTAAAYVGGYRLAHAPSRYPKVGVALMLLGSLLWGASIMLIGQMYSVGGEGGERSALLYWFIGTLPLAYVLRSPLHMGLSAVIWAVWFIMTIGDTMYFDGIPFFLFSLAIGALLCSLGVLHSIWERFKTLAPPLRMLGLGFMFVALYVFSFKDVWETQFYYSLQHANTLFIVWTAVAALVVAAVSIIVCRRRRQAAGVYEASGIIGVLIAGAIMVAIASSAVAGPRSDYNSSPYLVTAIVANLILLAAEIGVIALGWYRNRAGLINFGLVMFVLQVITRYFDTMMGMLQGGLVFIVAGLLLIPVAIAIERTRRRLVASASVRGIS